MVVTPGTDKDFPYWLVAAGAIGIAMAVVIAVNDLYFQVFTTVSHGVGITVFVTLVGFSLASGLGLLPRHHGAFKVNLVTSIRTILR